MMGGANLPFLLKDGLFTGRDPGNAGALAVDRNMIQFELVTAGSETRTLANPDRAGMLVGVVLKTDGGDCVLTTASAYDQGAHTDVTFDDAGDYAVFQSMAVGTGFRWRLIAAGGVSGPSLVIVGDDLLERSYLVADEDAIYPLALESFKPTDTPALLGTTANTPTGAFGCTVGTHGSAGPIIKGTAASNNSQTNKMRRQFTLPPEYVAGEDLTLRVRCAETVGAATVSTTIDAEVFALDKDGGVGSDLCATAAIDVTDTVGNKDFTVTGATLEPGDVLDIELTGVTNDTGGAVGTVLAVYDVALLFDVKG